MEGLGIIITMLIGIIYFFPSILASSRNHHNTEAIFILNLFVGWTLLGWVLSLVWASTKTGRR